ncbi:MAG: HEPN domain-containing protein [Rhabdochlamydiaceae bacterium]
MKNSEITRRIQKLNSLFESVALFTENLEMHAEWAKYLCVLVSGLLETSIGLIFLNYAESKSHENITSFIESNLSKFQNAKTGKIVELIGSFNQTWKTEFERIVVIDSDELKESIDSIVTNRHQIAHGKDVTITFISVRNHYKNILRVLDLLEKTVS